MRAHAVIGVAAIVLSIALADSVNPGTIVPALYLATGPRPVRAVVGFGLGFLAVNLVGGLVVLAVGTRVADLLPSVPSSVTHWAEVVAGCAALVLGVVLWRRRHRVSAAVGGTEVAVQRFAPAAGATLAAIELPTALPYFAALAAIGASGQPATVQVALVVAFNLVFLAPVFAIAVVAAVAGRRSEILLAVRAVVVRHSGSVAAALVAVVGVALLALGVRGLVA